MGIRHNVTYNVHTNWTTAIFSDNSTSAVNGSEDNFEEDVDIQTQAKSHPLYQTAMGFNMYYPPIIIITGFLGNSISLLVMLQRNNRKFSCCVYLAGLAIGDNLFMCNALHLWIMTAIVPVPFSNGHCTVIAYSFQVCAVNSTLLILAVTLERYLAICWPLKSATWRTAKRAKLTIPIVFFFSVIYNTPYLRTSGLSQKILCAAVAKTSTGSRVWAWWGFVINFIIPFCSLVTMNTFIVRAIQGRSKYLIPNEVKMKKTFKRSGTIETNINNIHIITKSGGTNESGNQELSRLSNGSNSAEKDSKSKRTRRLHFNQSKNKPAKRNDNISIKGIKRIASKNNVIRDKTIGSPTVSDHEGGLSDTSDGHETLGSRNSSDTENRHQKQLTVMLLVVTTTFLLLTSPQYIRYIIFSFLNITKNKQTFAFATLLYHLTNKLYYTNSSVNFFLYCIAGSKFRSDLSQLWRKHFKKRDNTTITCKESSASE